MISNTSQMTIYLYVYICKNLKVSKLIFFNSEKKFRFLSWLSLVFISSSEKFFWTQLRHIRTNNNARKNFKIKKLDKVK